MPNIQEYVNQRNPVTVYSPTRVLDRQHANAGTARRILASRRPPAWQDRAPGQQINMQQRPGVNLQLGQAPQQGMPAAPRFRSLDEMLSDHTPAEAPEVEEAGGWRGTLGHLVNGPIGRAVMAPLNVLDYPRRVLVSGVQEVADAFNGGDTSWEDFTHQIKEGIGFGDVIGSTGNIWLDRGIGFLGDVALDPLTYVGGAGILAGTGREARLGLASRVLELGMGEEAAQRVARIGIHALGDEERSTLRRLSQEAGGTFAEGAEKVKDAGYYIHLPFRHERQWRLPGTSYIDRVVGGAAARARSGLATTPFASFIRTRRVEQGLTEAVERVIGGKGTMSLTSALDVIAHAQGLKYGERAAARVAQSELARTLRAVPAGMTMADYTELVEREGGQAGNVLYERLAKGLEDVGINHGRVAPETKGGVWYVPRYLTPEGKGWYSGIDSEVAGKIFGAGHSLNDYSPSLMTRHVTGGDVEINGVKFHFPENATIRDINTEFRRVTGNKFNLFEEDFDKISARYIANFSQDVGEMTAAQRLLKSQSGNVRSVTDREAMGEVVNDAATKHATENKQAELKEQLNEVGTKIDEAKDVIAQGVRGVASGLLKPKLNSVIDELTAIRGTQAEALRVALDEDEAISRLLGRTPFGQAAPDQPAMGQLDAALERVWTETAADVTRLQTERADALRAAQLQHDQLTGELAKIPVQASNLEAPARREAMQRVRIAEQEILRLQRDRAAIGNLRDMMHKARLEAQAAENLAEDTSFTSLFLPGQADKRAAEVEGQRAALAGSDATERIYDRPEMSPAAITKYHNKERLNAFVYRPKPGEPPVSPTAALDRRAQELVGKISQQAQAFVEARNKLDDYVATHASALQGAKQKLEADTEHLATLRMRVDDLLAIPERLEERNAIRETMREFEIGQYAESKGEYERLRRELDDARNLTDEHAAALVQMQSDLVAVAKQIDEGRFRAQWRQPEAPVRPPEVKRTYTPDQVRAKHRERGELARQQREFLNSSEGAKYQVLDARRRQARRTKTQADETIRRLKGADYLLDANGNPTIGKAKDFEAYQALVDRDAAEGEVRLLAERRAAAESKLRESLINSEAGEITNAQAGRIARKAQADLDAIDAEYAVAVRERDRLNRLVTTHARNRDVPNVEITQRQFDALREAANTSKKMDGVLGELDSKLAAYVEVDTRRARMRQLGDELDLASREADMARGQAAAFAEAQAAFEAGPREIPQWPWTTGSGQGAGPLESAVRSINKTESKALAESARIIGYKIRWEDVPQITAAEALGLRGLSPEQRMAWNQALAIVRERHVFTGGVKNPIVAQARDTIRSLRQEMRNGLGRTDEEARNELGRMYDQMEELTLARGAWDPTTEQRELLTRAASIPEPHLRSYEQSLGPLQGPRIRTETAQEAERRAREVARGEVGAREEAMRKLVRGKGKGKGPRNASFEIADRARRAYRLARYMRDTHMPDLVARGALPPADRTLGRVDVAEFITSHIEKLGQSLERYGAQPTSFAVNQLEQQAMDVNRMAEFMIRYNRAIENGIEPSNSVAAFILTIGLGNESEALGKQISRAAKALEATEPSQLYRRWQARFGTQLPEELQAQLLTGEQLDELRYLNQTIPLESKIAEDKALIDQITEAQRAGQMTPELKGKRTTARNRLERNQAKLAKLESNKPTLGTMNQVIDRVANEIENQVIELDLSVSDFNDARHMVRDAQSIGEYKARTTAAIDRTEAELETFSQGQRRLSDAIRRAERAGRNVVRYSPVVQDDFFLTVEQARNALASGEIPAYLRPTIQAAIDRVERRAGSEAIRVTSVERERAVMRELIAKPEQTPEDLARIAEARQRIASFEQRRAGELEDRAAQAESFEEARRRAAAEAGYKPQKRLRADRERKISPERKAYAEAHGVDPSEVISTKAIRLADRDGMVEIPLDEAYKMSEQNKASVMQIRAAQQERRLRLSALDGSINSELRLQRQILVDQAQQELPSIEKLQATISEVNKRAARRRRPLDPIDDFGALGAAMADAPKMLERPADIEVSTMLLPHERELVELTQGRIDAIKRFGRMTPEQLADARDRLNEITSVIERTRAELGDHFDLASAAADGGGQFLTDLLSGRMELTTRGMEALHSLFGPEQGEGVGQFVQMMHQLLGMNSVPTREDLRDLLTQFGRPPVTGPARSLLFGTTDPSLEDLRQLRESLQTIPAERLDEARLAAREGWIAGIDNLLHPPFKAEREFTADEVATVFRALGTTLGTDLPILRNAEEHVMNLVGEGELITDDALRDTFREQLTEAARTHLADELRKSTDLVNMLGLQFSPGTPGFNGKLQAVGYVMGRQDLNRQKLRKFVVDGFGQIGLLANETAREQLQLKVLRKQRIDSMRIGLGAIIKDFDYAGDPREMFEQLGRRSMDTVADFDKQLAAFSATVVNPEGVDDIIAERMTSLQTQLERATEANDYDRINEIHAMQAELEGRVARAQVEPTEPPPNTQPTPEANPQVDYEAQVTQAEGAAASAHQQLNAAEQEFVRLRDQNIGAQTSAPVDLDAIPELARHPDTPEGMYSRGEVLRSAATLTKRTEAAGEEGADAVINEHERMTRNLWQGEPAESKKAATDAYKAAREMAAAPEASAAELEAAESAFNQAKAQAEQADAALERLRNEGPTQTVPPETPEASLGKIEAEHAVGDPDEMLDFQGVNNEYDAALAQLNALDETGPPEPPNLDRLPIAERDAAIEAANDSFEQQRAALAARVRKLATKRADMWPAERARITTERRTALAEAMGRSLVEDEITPQRAVTWQWAQVLTKGTPSADVLRRGRGIPSQEALAQGQLTVGKAASIVADVTGMRQHASGPFRQYALPNVQTNIERQLSPVEEMRAALLGARDDAAAERDRLNGLLAAYEGRDIDTELVAHQADLAEASGFLGGVPGAETAARMAAPLSEAQARIGSHVDNVMERTDNETLAAMNRFEEAQRQYTDAVAIADPGLAAVRTRIMQAETELARTEARIERAKALDFQGVSSEDMRQHVQDLRDINNQRRLLIKNPTGPVGPIQGPPAPPVYGPPTPAERAAAAGDPNAAIDDLADIDMIERLLQGANDQLDQLAGLELDHATITKRLADFASGAESVAAVMKDQIRDGWVPMLPRLAQGQNGLVIRAELFRAINNMNANLRKPQTWGLIGDYYTTFFKTYATATPGFHVRNLISGIFMNLVDNVRISEMVRAKRIWKDFTKDPYTYLDNADPNVRRAINVVFGSGAAGVFSDVANKEKGLILNNRLTRWNQRRGANVEGSLRLAMALDSMTKGQNVAAAMERVARYHFDYTTLSDFDHTARRLVPFWTFISRNIPLQIESMWLRPRTYLQYQSFVRNFGEPADPLTPEYWLSQGAFTMNQDAEGAQAPWYLAPDLPFLRVAEPFAALAQGDLGRAIGGSVNINPMIAAPMEAFAFNQKLYTGAPVEQEYNEPTNAMKPLMSLFALLGGTKTGGTSGEQLLDDRYAHVARSLLPTLNLIERLTDTSGTRAGRQDETFWRTLGAPVYQLTDELRESTRRGQYYDRRDARRTQAQIARS